MAIQHLQRIVITADTLANIEADAGALAEIVFGVDTDTGDLVYSIDDGATWTSVSGGSATGEKVKVSANDTTTGYLSDKLVAGNGITLTENNDGGNETLTIASIVSAGEVLMVDGVTPPEPTTTEDETDWLYED